MLGVEAVAHEVPELNLKATVALAPFTSISAAVSSLIDKAKRDPRHASADLPGENFNVALMTVGLQVESPNFDASSVMGDDLKRLLTQYRARCFVEAIAGLTAAMKARPQSFTGFKAGGMPSAQ